MTAGDWLVAVATTGVGLFAGTVSALLGIGGAVISTPAIRLLGASPILAVGSTVPAILPGTVAGSLRYAREGLVDWRVALSTGIAGSTFALIGAWVSDFVPGGLLMLATAGLMLWSGVTVVRGGRRAVREEGDGRASVPVLAAAGAAAGFVAGVLGVGGGIVLVPVLTGPLRLPMKQAVASSLVAVACFSIPAFVTHLWLGHIDWLYALPLILGAVPGARIGARLTLRYTDRSVRRIFGLFVIVLAIVYGVSELVALL